MRILYVEDNDANYLLVKKILAHDGHEVEHARDGTAALEAVRREFPRLVLMDLGLPGMDGYEVARRLRELSGFRAPIVALTASARRVDRERALGQGFAGFIEKPFRLDQFRKTIESHLAAAESGSSA